MDIIIGLNKFKPDCEKIEYILSDIFKNLHHKYKRFSKYLKNI